MAYLYSEQPLRTAATSVYPYSAALESIFTITPKYEEPFSLARKDGNVLHVPRELVPIGKEDFRVSYPIAAINCQLQPRNDDQKNCIEKSVSLLKKGTNHILEAPTGWGKSAVSVMIACQIGQPTIIFVTKEDLLVSWKKSLIAAGYNETQIGRVQGPTCNYKGKQFVLAMVQSFMDWGERYPPELFRYFGLVIADEIHRLGADKFSIVMSLFAAKYRLGLSATPDRKDGRMPLITAHIGQILVRGKQVPMAPKILIKKTGWKPPVGKFSVNEGGKWKTFVGTMPITPGRMMGTYKVMAEDAARNSLIVEFVLSAYKAGRNIIVMADLLDGHLKPLFHLLCAEGISGDQIGYYTSGLKPQQLEANAHKRIVLATYKMCSEGTDYPHWDTLVMATPHADVKQMIGRVMRTKEGKKQPVILDLVDNHSVLTSFFNTRQRQYYSVGATLVRLDPSS